MSSHCRHDLLQYLVAATHLACCLPAGN
jgi:hypothetical protein